MNAAKRKHKTLTRTPVSKPKPGGPGPVSAELKRRGVLPTVSKQRAMPPRGGKAPKRKAG